MGRTHPALRVSAIWGWSPRLHRQRFRDDGNAADSRHDRATLRVVVGAQPERDTGAARDGPPEGPPPDATAHPQRASPDRNRLTASRGTAVLAAGSSGERHWRAVHSVFRASAFVLVAT